MKATLSAFCLALILGLTLLTQPTFAATTPTHEWTRQLDTSSNDRSYDVSADGLGNVYLSGRRNISAFITKFSEPIPEPSTLLLSTFATLGLLLRRRR